MQQELQYETIKNGDYHLVFPNEIDTIPQIIKQKNSKCKKFMLVMDTNINRIYGQAIINHFQQIQDVEIHSFVISPGESQKSMENISNLLDQLFKNRFNRTDVIIGFGGGLITDFAAFAASIYKRGMKYVSIPTTVLAMSDAAIGSKAGVNNKYGKNMIGSFYDPSLIIVCEKFLQSLDDRNMSNGIAEIIKIAAMLDQDLFVLLELNDIKSLRSNPSILRQIIRRSMELKISVVSQDKFESDKRMILNYGHTIGHGIETASKENLLHGECVSIGIILANELALQKYFTSYQFTKRVYKLLVQYNLPTEVPKNMKNEDILFYMGNDKKMTDNMTFQFVFVEEVGKVIYQTKPVTTQEVLNVLSPSIKIGATDFTSLAENIVVQLAGSKSITNRALVLSALLDKEIELQNILFAEDTQVMMNPLQTLGACTIQQIDSTRIKIKGNGGVFNFENEKEIFVNNSGTSARFLCSVLSLLKPSQSVVIQCCDRMKERPIKDLIDALSDFLNFQYLEKEYHLPFRVSKKAEFKGGDIHINSKVSSQFVTGILMAAPYALLPTKVILTQQESITSESFIQMTYDMMKQFGAKIVREKQNVFKIENKKYEYNSDRYYIEPDAATASYDMAWAALNQKKVTIQGFNKDHSLQGDLKFTEKLIELGYSIEYNDLGVVIRGDQPRREATQTSFDFNDCTDTFITFSIILAALDDNSNQSYKITNIANQRVKECDRIHAVCLNLKKFGIKTIEHEDGLEILPNRNILLQKNSNSQFILIECFQDHRLGMAFSQLGNFIENNNQNSFNVVLDEGNCVNKTFPSFFNHLKTSYGVLSEKVHFSKERQQKVNRDEVNTLFFVGMRCCGKSTLAQKMCKLLNKDYLCMDEEIYKQFYSQKYSNLSEGINGEGWETFRKNELLKLKQILKENAISRKYQNSIISCGGGIVTIPEARDLLKQQKNVIWLRRDFTDIVQDFEKRTNVPGYVNSMKDDYDQRRALYEAVAHHTFNFPSYSFFSSSFGEKEYWGRVEKSLKRFIKGIYEKQTRNSGQDEYLYAEESHFLCMQFEDIKKLNFADLLYIQKNYHALEIRGDQYFENNFDNQSFNNNFVQLEEFSLVISRLSLICSKLTLIFTLRTHAEGGSLSKVNNNYFQIINYLQKQNIFNYIDVEIDRLSRDNTQNFNIIQLKHPLIISKHYMNHEEQQQNIQNTIQKMKDTVREQDILKLVLSSLTSQEEFETIKREFLAISPKSIIIQLGKSGKLSRIQNNFLTPVYDAKFGPPTGQGQLQKSEIVQLRNELNLTSHEKKFYIFGTDIKNSPSPLIHNTCFELLNLTNYHYQLAQIKNVNEIEQYLKHHDFLGATITMPFKQEVNQYLDYVIGDAKHIGIDLPVVNTIVKLNSKLYGFNTDWYGILKPLRKQLSLNQHYLKTQSKHALVIGAGATTMTMVYCLNILGFSTLIFNRTYSKIEKFIGWNGVVKGFSEMDELVDYLKANENIQLSVVASTIPGKVEMDYRDILFKYKPTIFDASYIPQETPLIQQAKLSGCTTFVYGLDMLLYQGYLQNQIFTGKKVSRKHIKNTTENYYKKLHCQQ